MFEKLDRRAQVIWDARMCEVERMKFEKIVRVESAYDKRSKDPSKNYGIGSMRMRFILKGDKGCVQVLINFPIFLPETVEEYKRIGNMNNTDPCDLRDEDGKPKGLECWDVGYHSPKPMFEGQTKRDCDI
ncbi:hypothetical protein LCGC14_0694260 [marine sediment metagenome]|uniref:Uncharacterized protein n=1 Tax=marine sediment metagenome TaxID=412755 RepID=A0A0F9QPI9_9ZZZZ